MANDEWGGRRKVETRAQSGKNNPFRIFQKKYILGVDNYGRRWEAGGREPDFGLPGLAAMAAEVVLWHINWLQVAN